ncbi:MAG TPA: hypothetical protein VNG51_12115 [Ktedonobacteraceae bacterium]|nr:hypothetical protein [Ktedonobacteraceae bacterium]
MRKNLWLQRMSVQAIIGLACLLTLAACASPTINQKATPTTIQSRSTPSPTPTLKPSATAAAPPATGDVILVYDDQMSDVLFLGDTFYSDPNQPEQTWIWNGSAWKQLHPAHEPSIRSNVAIAYDPATKQVVLFGGLSSLANTKMLSDTWTWDGTDWTQQYPATSPPARDDAALAYDAATNQLVLFGGGSSKPPIGGLVPPPLNDTWIWTGANWIQQHPATSPLPVLSPGLTYDAAQQNLLLFGGLYADTTPMRKELNDTWQWTGTNWVQLHPQTSPNLFDMVNGQQVLYSNPNMAYNPQNQQIFLLFGGDDDNNDKFQAGWTWDGTNWSKAKVNGPLTSADTGYLMYDARMQTVLEMTDFLPSTSISFDTTLWKLEGETWVKLDEWGLQ